MMQFVSKLNLNLPENLLKAIQSKADELKPHATGEEALSSFLQDLFIRVFMDLQPHDLIYGAIAKQDNSDLRPFTLELDLKKIEKFIELIQNQNLSGYENNMIELRNRLFKSFIDLEQLLSVSPSITFGSL